MKNGSIPALLAALVSTCAEVPDRSFDRAPPRVREVTPNDGATDVDPASTFAFAFARTTCPDCLPCDLDPATLVGRISFNVSLPRAPMVRLDVESCAARIVVPGGLAPNTSYALTLSPGVRDRFGNASAERVSVIFKTGERRSADTIAPRLVGIWPPEQELPLGRRSAVSLYFDEEVRGTAAVSAGGVTVLPSAHPEAYALALAPATEWPAASCS